MGGLQGFRKIIKWEEGQSKQGECEQNIKEKTEMKLGLTLLNTSLTLLTLVFLVYCRAAYSNKT